MPDKQILAIYYRYESDQHAKKVVHKSDEPVVQISEQIKEIAFIPDAGEQLSFWQ